MNARSSLRVGEELWGAVQSHILQPDRDEHGGALLCGIAITSRGIRLLAREFIPAQDGRDYVPGTRGYRELTPSFIRQSLNRARTRNLVCLLVHGHGQGASVAFSQTDNASHERGYPALRDISAQTVGALVLASGAVAGDIWHKDGSRTELDVTVVVGNNLRRSTASPRNAAGVRPEDDRQARLFGDVGQQILREARIGIVGAGGAGMLAVEMLSRLGVGQLVVVDPDRVELTNLTRLPGAYRRDACAILTGPDRPRWVRRVGLKLSRPKVRIAARLARQAGQGTTVEAYPVDVRDSAAVAALLDCDFILLAADTAAARHIVNIISHQYLIPLVQVGVKVPVSEIGEVGDLFAAVRPVAPDGGCLRCAGLIDSSQLAVDLILDRRERELADYGTGQSSPSVITLNAMAVGEALTHITFALTGLNEPGPIVHIRKHARRGARVIGEPHRDDDCKVCGSDGVTALGDLVPLPLPRV
jgi:molybdopterin/thiamine biosynthesis adenylyltransferase